MASAKLWKISNLNSGRQRLALSSRVPINLPWMTITPVKSQTMVMELHFSSCSPLNIVVLHLRLTADTPILEFRTPETQTHRQRT